MVDTYCSDFDVQEWVTDTPFVISPRITLEVSVRLLGGLMALGYTIATILKRNSHVFATEKVCVKIDWLEQLNRHYMQVCLSKTHSPPDSSRNLYSSVMWLYDDYKNIILNL